MMRALLIAALAASAAVAALLLNLAVLTHAAPSVDPVGRLSPSAAIVPATQPAAPAPATRPVHEIPDD